MALDESKDTDETFVVGKYTYAVEKELFEQTGDLRIDMTYYGFTIDSQNPVGGGSGGCSSGSCSSGGCG